MKISLLAWWERWLISIRVRHTFINADWVARMTRPSGNMRKATVSRLSRRILTFRNEACCTATHPRSSGFVQRTARVPRSRVSCGRLSRSSLGSFRKMKSPAWFWAFEPRPSSSFPLLAFFSKGATVASYYCARYYDQNIGRFLTEDPKAYAGRSSLYNYVGGNPTTYTDPSGNVRIYGNRCQRSFRTDPVACI